MTKVPSCWLQGGDWVAVRLERGPYIRLQKYTSKGISSLTVPAHRPIKRSTLSPSEASLQTNEP
uniref:Uncharacterized protein n=1 Tax=Candidatus Kentrum sp. SD TaxID=2126332 RepID=A0A450YSA4_9GAMM|nr:MAG: hypothetical protein BECKSD772F_GA0070984_11378 [Candidatus Kentron sp. SD]VFK44386.1 MAG: hypothetical protein BECKSD772E_GA0070983_10373 [Candidatus Kentron sp. SD]